VAHNVQICYANQRGSSSGRVLARCTAMIAMCFSSGCLIPPPIEPEPPEINRAPFIDPDRVLPADPFIVVTDSTPISIAASQLFDPNVENALFYAFLGQRGGQLKNSQAQIAPDLTDLHRGVYVQYEGADFVFNPCGVATRDAESETIFLYVTDRPFQEITSDSVTPADDAFMVSFSWVFQIAEGACAN